MPTEVTSPDGTTLSVVHRGQGEPLVWVDPAGAFEGSRPLGDVVAGLAQSRAVFTYDRRGRGRSGDAPASELADEISDVRAVVALAGASGRPVTLFGFSSGAALVLHAAANGVPAARVVALEPPVELDGPPDTAFVDELAALLARGQHGEAVRFFSRSTGVPEEVLDQIETSPVWPELERIAPTLMHDVEATSTLTREVLARVSHPVTVLASAGSDAFLIGAARAVAEALPHGAYLELPGTWHGPETSSLLELLRHP